MRNYMLKRILQAIGVVFAISAITFFVLNVVPGDPVRLMMGELVDDAVIEQVRHTMGLDRPLIEQYVTWIAGIFQGDFGISYTQRQPVITLMVNAFAVTAKLAVAAYVFALVLGVVSGCVAAIFHGTWIDRTIMSVMILGISAPVFWVAIILQIIFSLKFNLFPLSGVATPAHFVLPTLALGVRYAAAISRVTRTSMLDVLGQDYMRTSKAKGLSWFVVNVKHGLRNALIPIITIAGTELGNIFTGSILIESIFSMPGMGKLLLDAINMRDLPLVQGGVMYIAIVCVVVYLLVDVAYAFADPRIRLGKEAE